MGAMPVGPRRARGAAPPPTVRRPLSRPGAALAAMLRGETCVPGDPPRFVEACVADNLAGSALAAVAAGRLVLPPSGSRNLSDTQLRRVAATALLRRERGTIVRTELLRLRDARRGHGGALRRLEVIHHGLLVVAWIDRG